MEDGWATMGISRGLAVMLCYQKTRLFNPWGHPRSCRLEIADLLLQVRYLALQAQCHFTLACAAATPGMIALLACCRHEGLQLTSIIEPPCVPLLTHCRLCLTTQL